MWPVGPPKKGEKPAGELANALARVVEVRGAKDPRQRADLVQEAEYANEQKKAKNAEGGIDPFDNPFDDGNLFDDENPFDEGGPFDDELCDFWGENEL